MYPLISRISIFKLLRDDISFKSDTSYFFSLLICRPYFSKIKKKTSFTQIFFFLIPPGLSKTKKKINKNTKKQQQKSKKKMKKKVIIIISNKKQKAKQKHDCYHCLVVRHEQTLNVDSTLISVEITSNVVNMISSLNRCHLVNVDSTLKFNTETTMNLVDTKKKIVDTLKCSEITITIRWKSKLILTLKQRRLT